jgi:hypothetical protein
VQLAASDHTGLVRAIAVLHLAPAFNQQLRNL